MNEKNQKSQTNQKNRNNHGRHERRRHSDEKSEIMQVTFGKKDFGDGDGPRPVSYMGDLMVFPGTFRFNPHTDGKPYQCRVNFRDDGRNGTKVARAFPLEKYLLGDDEYLTLTAWRVFMSDLELVFENRNGKIMSRFQGRIVFPDSGVNVPVGKPVRCSLRERGTICFAVPHQVVVTETGMVKLSDALAKAAKDLSIVVQTVYRNVANVVVAYTDDQVMVTKETKSIFTVLGVAPGAAAKEIEAAYRRKMQAMHPDKAYAAFGGDESKAPLVMRKNVQEICATLKEAKEAALELLKHGKGKGPAATAPKAETVTKAASPAAPKAAPAAATKPVQAPKAETKPVDKDEAMADKIVCAVLGVNSISELRDETVPVVDEPAKPAPVPAPVVATAPAEKTVDRSQLSATEKFNLKYKDAPKSGQTSKKARTADEKKADTKPQTLAEQLAAVQSSLNK